MIVSKSQIEITTKTILKFVFILLMIWFLFSILNIIALFFISIIIVSAIKPSVDWLEGKKIPRSVSVLSLYLLLFIILGLGIYFLIFPMAKQFSDFAKDAPSYYEKLSNSFIPLNDFFRLNHINVSAQNFFDEISKWLSNVPQHIFSTTVGVFSGFISTIAVLSMAFYMAVEKDGTKKFIVMVIPKKYEKYAIDLASRAEKKIGKWLQGQVFLMIIIGVVDFLGLWLAGVPYALVLGVFAGIFEIIPYVGPIISAVPGVFLGFLVSPLVGFSALLVYLLSQQLENNILVPLIMKKAVGLNPVAVMLALLTGAQLGGIMGAILAIPVATFFGLLVFDLVDKN